MSGASVAAPLVGTPIVQAAPTPADKPVPSGVPPATQRFAEMLRRSHADVPKSAPTQPSHPARAAATTEGREAGDTTSIEAKAAPANAARARAATPKAAAEKGTGRDQAHGCDESDAVASDDVRGDGDRIGRPASRVSVGDRVDAGPLAAIAIDALRRADLAPTGASDDGNAGSTEDGEASSAVGGGSRYSPGHARGMAAIETTNQRRASALDASRDSALRVAGDARSQLAASDIAHAVDSVSATPVRDRAVDALTASLGIGASTHGADAPAGATPSATLALATPVDAPDFAAALGIQVSLLVQDGVQRADLHLNPAETGPVSIHITLDGTAARVDFGADVAATRAAIERGLPELASALRDAGFTLAGGGVSQHAGNRAGTGDDDAGRSTTGLEGAGRTASARIATESRRASRAVVAGGIDLYA